MDIATISKIPYADRPELVHTSLRHHGGLNRCGNQEIVSKDPRRFLKVNNLPLERLYIFEFH
jgi:hypothetical protein